jgi:long-chain acyl-CoA synthetase
MAETNENLYEKKPWLAHYDEGVPAEIDFPEINLYEILDNAAKKFGSSTAIYYAENRINYNKLKDLTDRLATALVELGVKKGDRVALLMPNFPQYIIAFYGILKAGAIVSASNVLYTEHELLYQINDSGAEVLIAHDSQLEKINNIRNSTSLRHVVISNYMDYGPKGSKNPPEIAGTIQLVKLLDKTKPNPPKFKTDAKEDIAVFQYTGGTTGLPKGAMLTHYNLVSNLITVYEWSKNVRRNGRDIVLTQLPLNHIYGTTVCMNTFIYNGSCIAFNPDLRDQKSFFEVIKAVKPAFLPGVPKMYSDLLERDDFMDYIKEFKCIKICNSGASAMPQQVMKEFEAMTGAKIIEGYGMSETSPCTISNPTEGERKIGSVGLPLPNTEIKIVDVDDYTKIVPLGEPGELMIKGPQVMKGYWNHPEETANQVKDEWILTGDIAQMDADGYVFIVDRKKDMINISGFKVYPREVEDVLLEFGSIENAAILGIPNPEYPEREMVKAYIILKDGYKESEETLADIKEFCRTNLAPFKVPKEFEFRKELPLTVIGKTKKKDLQQHEKLNRGEEV